MTTDAFRDEVKRRIKDFSYEETIYFAWLCAVRVLPFLSAERKFKYWEEQDRQKHLFSIFRAIDTAAIADDADVAAIADVAADAAIASASAIASAADVADAAFFAATVAADVAATADDAAIAATTAFFATTVAAADDVAATVANNQKEFSVVILSDIDAITAKARKTYHNDVSIYGEIWHHFLADLRGIGCGYWANLYEELFRNGFVVDEEELERRLNVPDEIKAQGAAAVGQYLERLGDDTERLNEARIIILGEKGAGKTSIARKLIDIDADLPQEHESTPGVSVLGWRLEDNQGGDAMNVHIWDFAGHAITHAAHRCFMSSRCLYIYVYDGRGEHANRPDYWLEQIRVYGGQSPVLFLINEKDDHRPNVERKTLQNRYPSIQDYYSFDIWSEDQEKLKSFRGAVADLLRNNPAWNRQEISADAYRIKEELRTHFENNRADSITREQFDEIAEKTDASPEMHGKILEDLHTLGICLWYNTEDMRDFNQLVLNPDWISNGIYKIINWGDKKEKHIMSVDDVTEIFTGEDKPRYPRDKIRFLFKLMNVYELAFFKDSQIFVPILLPADRPDTFPDFPDDERLTMCFHVEKALPPNVVSRLIVRHNEELGDENEVWRKGAVLRYCSGDAIALAIEDERSIHVRVKGADKTQYISHLRDTLKAIFESYKEMHPDVLYEVLVPEEINVPIPVRREPLLLKGETILAHLRAGRPYLDEFSGKDITLVAIGDYYDLRTITNGFTGSELLGLIAEIRNHAWESPDEFKTIAESLKTIENELTQQNEKSPGLLKKTLSGLRAVNDTKKFGTTVHSLAQSLQTFLETCS